MDDTGGGHSMTNFLHSYWEADTSLAQAALERAFGIKPDHRAEMYGEVFAWSSYKSLREASWHERGCQWDYKRKEPIEQAEPGGWRKWISLEDWRKNAVEDLGLARETASSWSQADRRDQNIFIARRPLCLALGINQLEENYPDHELRGQWALEWLEEMERRPPIESAASQAAERQEMRAAWLGIWTQAAWVAEAMLRPEGEDAPSSWVQVIDKLNPRAARWAWESGLNAKEKKRLTESVGSWLMLRGSKEPLESTARDWPTEMIPAIQAGLDELAASDAWAPWMSPREIHERARRAQSHLEAALLETLAEPPQDHQKPRAPKAL